MTDTISVIGIDPGTHFTGIALVEIRNGLLYLEHVETVDANRLNNDTVTLQYLHDERFTRIIGITSYVKDFVVNTSPHFVCCEKNHLSKFPQAGLVLGELISSIRYAIYNELPYLRFELAEASAVKKNIGVKGNSGNKLDMTEAVLNQNLNINSNIDIAALDEHSIDAIAIALFKCYDLIDI